MNEGKTDEAIETFKQAIHERPVGWNIDPFEDCLANAYLDLNRLDEAIAEYERIVRLNPNYPRLHFHLAQAYDRKGQSERARAAYEEFLSVWKEIPMCRKYKRRIPG